MTGQELISSACRLIGVLASGETLPNDIATDALMVLQQMLDSWSAERLTVYTITRDTFSLVALQQTYTYGSGGDFDAPRPPKLYRASIVSLSNPNQPLELPIDMYTDWDWQNVAVKNIQTSLPNGVYDDGAFPFRNLSYWPIPNTNVDTVLYGWTALSGFSNLTTDYTFPPGYAEALRYNLAVRLIAEMPGEFNPVMISTTGTLAVESLARIRSMNQPFIQTKIDQTLLNTRSYYNFYSDQPVGWGRK